MSDSTEERDQKLRDLVKFLHDKIDEMSEVLNPRSEVGKSEKELEEIVTEILEKFCKRWQDSPGKEEPTLIARAVSDVMAEVKFRVRDMARDEDIREQEDGIEKRMRVMGLDPKGDPITDPDEVPF